MSHSFYALGQGFCCWDDLDAVLGVLEGDMSVMGTVSLMGGHTVGGTAGGTVGLAMDGKAVA